jgi:predicted helicase
MTLWKAENLIRVSLVDTFELAEPEQGALSFMSEENTARVKKQKEAPIFVVVGNPPYNANQQNENANNKNRRYPVVDRRVSETYVHDSRATNNNALSDPYVKAIRWASDRIGKTGIVALVTNNSFVDDVAFDGMRKHLLADFTSIYVLDLGGNVRKNPKLSGTTHNVFGIQVGVSISLLVRTPERLDGKVHYLRFAENATQFTKLEALETFGSYEGAPWTLLVPNNNR